MSERLREIVYHYDSLASTKDTARELADADAVEGTTVLALEQTAGRGRHGRRWLSPKGEGLYHSIILRPEIPPAKAPLLGLVAAIALAETLREEYEIQADIKWPNDILIEERKLAGILLELETDNDTVKYVILGIGVNLNQTEFLQDLDQPATSLRLETGMSYDIEGFRRRLFARLDHWYEQFLATGSEPIIRRYSELSSYVHGKLVQVQTAERFITGRTYCLNSEGALLVESPGGKIEAILAGDVKKLERPSERT